MAVVALCKYNRRAGIPADLSLLCLTRIYDGEVRIAMICQLAKSQFRIPEFQNQRTFVS